MSSSLEAALDLIRGWGAGHAAVAVVGADGILSSVGDPARPAEWASVTKLVTAYAVLRAVERGDIALDEPYGPPAATVRHLLAHASGLGPEGSAPISAPERTRIYSNVGYDLLGTLLEERSGRPIARVLEDDVLEPLGMTTTQLIGRPSAGLRGSLNDLARFGRELLRPSLTSPGTLAAATTVAFPALPGCFRASVASTRLIGVSASSCAMERTRTGRGHAIRPRRSGTSGRAARSCGWIRWRTSPSPASPNALSGRGRWRQWPALSDAVLQAAAQV